MNKNGLETGGGCGKVVVDSVVMCGCEGVGGYESGGVGRSVSGGGGGSIFL